MEIQAGFVTKTLAAIAGYDPRKPIRRYEDKSRWYTGTGWDGERRWGGAVSHKLIDIGLAADRFLERRR